MFVCQCVCVATSTATSTTHTITTLHTYTTTTRTLLQLPPLHIPALQLLFLYEAFRLELFLFLHLEWETWQSHLLISWVQRLWTIKVFVTEAPQPEAKWTWSSWSHRHVALQLWNWVNCLPDWLTACLSLQQLFVWVDAKISNALQVSCHQNTWLCSEETCKSWWGFYDGSDLCKQVEACVAVADIFCVNEQNFNECHKWRKKCKTKKNEKLSSNWYFG